MLWGSVLVVEFGFEIPGKNLVNFITRWFCGDKNKSEPPEGSNNF